MATRRDLRRVASSFGEWPSGVVRLGALLTAVLAAVVAIDLFFSDSLPGTDFWASRNAGLSYVERSVPFEAAVGSPEVAEDARLWMPETATYRIVKAEDLSGPLDWAAPDFLAAFLLPRREVESDDAEWVFCLQCDPASLGEGFEVLSDSGEGVLFGRSLR